MIPYLIHLRPLDLLTGQRVDIYVGSASDATALGLGSIEWEPAIARRPRIAQDLMSIDLDGKFKLAAADFVLSLNQIRNHPDTSRLTWGGARLTIYSAADLSWSRRVVEFNGIISNAPPDLITNRLTVNATVDRTRIDKPLLTNEFTGGGGEGGDAAMRGKVMPAGFGYVENVEWVLFDTINNIGMLDGYGNLIEVVKAMEGLSDLGPSVGDYPTYQGLKDAITNKTIPAGRWGTCLAKGMVGFGAPLTGRVSFVARFGSNRTGAILKRVMTVHGKIDPVGIDTDSFDALDASANVEVRAHWREQIQIADVIEKMCQPLNATPLITVQNHIAVSRAAVVAPTFVLNRNGSSLPVITDWRLADVIDPLYKSIYRVEQPASVFSFDQVNYADDLIDLGLYSADTTYRQGNIVWLADKSQWLYTNDTPTKGNLPAVGSAYWRQMQSGTDANTIRYPSGYTLADKEPGEKGANVTENRTSAAISGQGALATQNQLANGSQYLTGFGSLSGLGNVWFGSPYLLESGGGPMAGLNAFKTILGISSGFSGQGALATLSQLALGSNFLTGFGAFAGLSSAGYGTPYLTGFGALSPLSSIAFGSNYLLEQIGGAAASLSAFKTALGISSGIAGQGWFATQNTADYADRITGISKPVTYTVGSRGNSTPSDYIADYKNGLWRGDGTAISSGDDRSYTVCVLESNGSWAVTVYDVFASNNGDIAAAMANYLNNITPGKTVVIYTSDEPSVSRLSGGLPNAMYRCGASRTNFANPWKYRSAYVLVGSAGCGEGNGFEQYEDGGMDSSPRSMVFFSFVLVNGRPQVNGRTIRSAADLQFQDGVYLQDRQPQEAGANITENRTSAAITGQGALATLSQLSNGGQYLTGFGALSGMSSVYFGSPYLLESSGGSSAGLSAFKTILGISSGFSGQGSFATRNAIAFSEVGDRWAGFSHYGAVEEGVMVESLRPGERGANITEKRTSAAITGQSQLATASFGLNPAGAIEANNIDYYGVGRLKDYWPQDVGSNRTESRTAAAFTGQGQLATRDNVDFATQVNGASKPVTYRVSSRGNGAGGSTPPGYQHGLWTDNQTAINADYRRSYTVCWQNRATGVWSTRPFDVYGGGYVDYGYGTGNAANGPLGMANYLNSIPIGCPVIVFTSDEPLTNRGSDGLLAAMYRCGASRTTFGGTWNSHGAYILVGYAGAGEGNGIERYEDGGEPSSPRSFAEMSFTIVNGLVQAGGKTLTSASQLQYADGVRVGDRQPAQAGSDVTRSNTAAGFAGQGGLATKNAANYGTDILGLPMGIAPANIRSDGFFDSYFMKYYSGRNVNMVEPQEAGSNVTENRTSAAIQGQGSFATRNGINFNEVGDRWAGFSHYGAIEEGVMVDSLRPGERGANITENRTSAALAGQSYLATNYPGRLQPSPQHGESYLAASAMAFSAGYTVEDLRPGERGSNVTETRTASAVYGQSQLATASFGLNPAGAIEANNIDYYGVGRLKDYWPQDVGSNRTESRTAAAITGQTAFATSQGINRDTIFNMGFFNLNAFSLGYSITRSDGATTVTESMTITQLGVAAGFVNQGGLATRNNVNLNDIQSAGLFTSRVNGQGRGFELDNAGLRSYSDNGTLTVELAF